MMKFNDFQDALVRELTDVLADAQWTDHNGYECEGVNVFANLLPKWSTDDDLMRLYPYAIVRIENGVTASAVDCWHVNASIVLSGYSNDMTNSGHEFVQTVIQKITDRFVEDDLLDAQYRAEGDIEWTVQDTDEWPFFYGGVMLKFQVPKIPRKDPYG